MKKKIISLCLAVVLVLGCCSAAFAADSSLVVYDSSESYTVTVPEYIVPQAYGEDPDATANSVTASNVKLEAGTELSVTVSYGGVMEEENGIELGYEFFDEEGKIENGSVILTQPAGDPEATVTAQFGAQNTETEKYAGVYTDTAVFNAHVNKVRDEVTAEEIEESPYLFGIGRTKPEYVIAEFNEDFTHVDIYKNGDESDGLSKHFTSPTADPTYPIYNNRATLQTVTVEEGVVGLGGNAFAMTNITSITLPDSLREIGAGCFNACRQLQGIVIPDGVTVIDRSAFNNCVNMSSELDLPSSLTTLGSQAFRNCSNLYGSVNIPSSLTAIGDMAFQNCSGLDGTIDFGEGLQTIGLQAFYGCTGLTGNLDFPDSVVTIGQYAFGSDTGLDGTITFGSGLETIEPYAFSGCSNITGGLTMPDSLNSIGAFAFQFMRGLNGTLTLNEGLELIGDGAFNHCQNMANTTLTIPSTVETMGGGRSYEVTEEDGIISSGAADKNTEIGTHIFYDFATGHIQSYQVAAGNADFKAADGVLFTADGTRLIAYPASREGSTYEIPEGVNRIDEMAFSRTINGSAENKLQTLILPNSYVIKTTNQEENILNRAYSNSLASSLYTHTSLTSIQVKADNERYTSIDGCLYSKDGKTLYYVPVAKSGALSIADGTETIMFGAFIGLDKADEHPNLNHGLSLFTNLTSIYIPDSVSTVYNVTLTRLNIFLKAGGSLAIAEGNPAIAVEGDEVVALKETSGSDGWMEI